MLVLFLVGELTLPVSVSSPLLPSNEPVTLLTALSSQGAKHVVHHAPVFPCSLSVVPSVPSRVDGHTP